MCYLATSFPSFFHTRVLINGKSGEISCRFYQKRVIFLPSSAHGSVTKSLKAFFLLSFSLVTYNTTTNHSYTKMSSSKYIILSVLLCIIAQAQGAFYVTNFFTNANCTGEAYNAVYKSYPDGQSCNPDPCSPTSSNTFTSMFLKKNDFKFNFNVIVQL